MQIDGRKLSIQEKAFVRRISVQRVLDGERPCNVTASYGLSPKSIFRWLKKAREEGINSLAPKPKPGRRRKLTEKEEQEVKRWIVGKDPRQYNFDFGLWTREIVSDLILDRIGIKLSVNSVGRLLHRQGLTPQKPLRRAYERDPEATDKWVKEDYVRIRKRAKQRKAEIFWLDEASIRSDDPLQRTWGLKGKTPIVQTSGQRQSINAISALSNKGGFWYMVYTGRFNATKFIECLKNFMRYRRKPVFLIMDGHPVHKAKAVKEYIKGLKGKLEIYLLPPYAPDLNPDELVWNQMRNIGTSKKPLKKGESLKKRAIFDLESIKNKKKLILSFFKNDKVSYAVA